MNAETGVREATIRLQELYYKYNRVVSELTVLRSRLSEIAEAKKVLEKRIERKIYREIGGLIIEVSREEALEYLNEEEEVVRVRLKKLEAEQRKLLEEIRRLEKIIGG